MKVLIINRNDIDGGAANAALQLVNSLNAHNIYARLGVKEKKSSNSYVFELPVKKHLLSIKNSKYTKLKKIFAKYFINNILYKLFFKTTNNILHTTNFNSETDINWINNSEFDIVNLHWISGVISNKDIAKIKKPVVWTMHDSWPCCGAEHHPNVIENDNRWKEGYFRKNKPKSTKGIDLCLKVWKQKKKYLGTKNIVFTAPSKWEQDVLKSSALFGHCECKVIPNIIDHSIFYPKNKNAVKKLLNIPNDKTILGFGAAYDIDNPKSMKGSYYLLQTLSKLKNPEQYFIVIFGPAGESFTRNVSLPFFASGYIRNSHILSCIYSACDIFINTSLIENMSYTNLEAISCGVPVVAFDVGGTSDIVVHKENGYLATPYNTDELLEGIEWCKVNLKRLSKECNKKSLKDFDEDQTINKMLQAYNEALK